MGLHHLKGRCHNLSCFQLQTLHWHPHCFGPLKLERDVESLSATPADSLLAFGEPNPRGMLKPLIALPLIGCFASVEVSKSFTTTA